MTPEQQRTSVLRRGEFSGHCLARRETAGITFSDYAFPPRHVAPAHVHESPHFYLVLRGTFRERCDGKARTGTQCALLFCPAGEQHEDEWDAHGGRCFNVEFTPARAEQLRLYTPALDRSNLVHDGRLVVLAARLYEEFRRTDRAALLAAEGMVLELLALAGRQPAERSDVRTALWLREAHAFVADRFSENLTLAQIAEQVGVHPSHLARAFRQRYHCTVGEFLRQRRLERAREALVRTDAALLEIALEAGYSDQSHFTSAFRRHAGMTPAAYRRTFRR